MKRRTVTGGVRINYFNATWPFARLDIRSDSLVIRLFYFKKITVPKCEIEDVKEYFFLPLIGEGIEIKLKSEKKFGTGIFETDKIIFWFFGNKTELRDTVVKILDMNN